MIGHAAATVLVLDSDDAVLDLLTQALALLGYDAMCCRDDAEAIAGLRYHTPDLVVLNPGAHGLVGSDVLTVMEENFFLADVPILICETIARHRDGPPAAPRSRAWDAITMPFDLDDFLDRVNSLVAARSQKIELGFEDSHLDYESLVGSASDLYSPQVTAHTAN